MSTWQVENMCVCCVEMERILLVSIVNPQTSEWDCSLEYCPVQYSTDEKYD